MTNRDEGAPQEVFFRMSGTGNSPWEIGRPQPVIIKLVEQGVFHGEVLDIGCGIGDNAVYIAKQANNVHLTAIDLVKIHFFLSNKSFFFRYLKRLKSHVKKLWKIMLIFNLKMLICLMIFLKPI